VVSDEVIDIFSAAGLKFTPGCAFH